MKIRRKLLNESRHIGFIEPEKDSPVNILKADVDGDLSDPLYRKYDKNRVSVQNVKLWNTDTPNKVIYNNDRMYAGQYFEPGDTVEKAPVKLMTDKDMYSENIRDCAFTIDKGKGIYALPLGYAVCYRNSIDTGIDGNIDYEYDEITNTIKIYAISKIKKGAELIFISTEEDFANEIRPGQFQYNDGIDPIYSTSNIRIV